MKTLLHFAISLTMVISLGFCVKADEEQLSASIAIGYGSYSSIMAHGSEQNFYLLPRWSYYHNNFYIENLDLGYNFAELNDWSFDLTSKQSFDSLLFRGDSVSDALLRGIMANPDLPLNAPFNTPLQDLLTPQTRRSSYLAGASVFWHSEHFQFKSAMHTDITSVHNGYEFSNELRGLFQTEQFSIATTAGIRYLDKKYSDYYFSVTHADTTGSYQFLPGASWLPSFKLETSWKLNEELRILLHARREWMPSNFDGSIHIVKQHHDIMFMGLIWMP
ncbi:MipA/OmpV family protein [Psychrosphaera sp. 1_MG-2023]|uniref:MipA/OmpV family protein n=1 Tax=Psychrosphaera sp. 1_MG-2023 TaxID=3062643 RepID=UPI0026E1EA4E|nr:MipA/OmpV family protein [Psychrosphaera sp. 1_MG-2023]MDO6719645.1 MipA/OmpV family protein [Psychrosphaera sp. 1_MG-2023]